MAPITLNIRPKSGIIGLRAGQPRSAMNRTERQVPNTPPRAAAALVRVALVCLLALSASGCGHFVARRMTQAPNTYPRWLSPPARVELAFDAVLLTNFPPHFVAVGPPAARLRYRIVEPANYDFSTTTTNWMKRGRPYYHFSFATKFTGPTNEWTAHPRGTVLLLHGYGVAQFAMAPWAMRLAQDGWRCVLVDLRGHGKSTGRRIYYGVQETHDLCQLLDQLERDGHLAGPVAALGTSFGAALALRLKASDSRVEHAVAIAPYAVLSNAVQNICREYADWIPGWMSRQAMKRLPTLLKVPPEELDTTTVLARQPVTALFVAGGGDKISPASEVRKLYAAAAPDSEFIVIPQASHEAVTYYFNGLVEPVRDWLRREELTEATKPNTARAQHAGPVNGSRPARKLRRGN
jgi:pimeloyl-ACP methyl ester carboxylesterase